MTPSIDPRIAALAPDFKAVSVVMEVGEPFVAAVAEKALQEAYRAVGRSEPEWATQHLAAWAQAFQRFGAKPQATEVAVKATMQPKKYLRRPIRSPNQADTGNTIALAMA